MLILDDGQGHDGQGHALVQASYHREDLLREPLLCKDSLQVSSGSLLVNDDSEDSSSSATVATILIEENESSEPRTENSMTIPSSLVWNGPFLLLLVSFLFATLNTSLRSLCLFPHPLSTPALCAIRGWWIMILFVPILLIHYCRQQRKQKKQQQQHRHIQPSTIPSGQDEENAPSSSSSSSIWKAAMELTIFNFLGQELYIWGIGHISSARASFLGQTTVVFVPIICLMRGERLHVWDGIGCLSSLIGLMILLLFPPNSSMDNHDSTTTTDKNVLSQYIPFGFGDVLILCSAICWSFYIVGTSRYAHHHDAIYLQGSKNTFLAILYTVWWWIVGAVHDYHHEKKQKFSLWSGISITWNETFGNQKGMAWLILIYSAWGPGVLADLFQQRAQSNMKGIGSSLILSMELVFSAILGRIFLGEETSWMEKSGGFCLIIGAIIAGQRDKNKT